MTNEPRPLVDELAAALRAIVEEDGFRGSGLMRKRIDAARAALVRYEREKSITPNSIEMLRVCVAVMSGENTEDATADVIRMAKAALTSYDAERLAAFVKLQPLPSDVVVEKFAPVLDEYADANKIVIRYDAERSCCPEAPEPECTCPTTDIGNGVRVPMVRDRYCPQHG